MLVYQRVIPYLASMNIHKNPSDVGPGEASAATSPSSCSWQGAKFSAIASMVEWLIHVLCFPMLAVSGFLDCFVFFSAWFLLCRMWICSGWWFGTFVIFHNILYGIILPIDFHVFQRGRTTTNQC